MSDIPLRSLKGRKLYKPGGYQPLNADGEDDNYPSPEPNSGSSTNKTNGHSSSGANRMSAARTAAAAASNHNLRKKGKARQQYYHDSEMEEEEETLLRREPGEEELTESAVVEREGSLQTQSTIESVCFLINFCLPHTLISRL